MNLFDIILDKVAYRAVELTKEYRAKSTGLEKVNPFDRVSRIKTLLGEVTILKEDEIQMEDMIQLQKILLEVGAETLLGLLSISISIENAVQAGRTN